MALLVVALALGFAAGALTGRWWALLAIPPIALLISQEGELEGSLNTWIAFVVSVAFACGLAAGIAFHRARARARSH